MTPLAMQVVKDLTKPVKDRSQYDFGKILNMMSDVHTFDVTQVRDAAIDLGKTSLLESGLAAQQTFLPAPRTWIETVSSAGSDERIGYLVTEAGLGVICIHQVVCQTKKWWVSDSRPFFLDLNWRFNRGGRDTPIYDLVSTPSVFTQIAHQMGRGSAENTYGASWGASLVLGALAFINSPRVIGRVVHSPHRGLQRDLLNQQKTLGAFPLHGWTEIILDVTPPKDAEGQHDYEAHLTGRRALHFVRAHLRIRDGKLQFVKSHWRGDAAIGIKQSRYRVASRRGL